MNLDNSDIDTCHQNRPSMKVLPFLVILVLVVVAAAAVHDHRHYRLIDYQTKPFYNRFFSLISIVSSSMIKKMTLHK